MQILKKIIILSWMPVRDIKSDLPDKDAQPFIHKNSIHYVLLLALNGEVSALMV